MEEAEGKRLLNLKVAAMQEAAGLYKAELKYTDAKGKKYRRWFLMMPRGADGTLALDKPRFAPKDQVKLVNELDKHWDDLRDYSDMNIRRCSVTSQNMSEITEVLDALDAVFRDTDVPVAKPQEVETVINLIDAGKYQPPATAASPSNAKRGRRSSSPPEGRTEGASDEAEEGQTPGPGGELPHVPPPPPPFPSSWPLPVTHPATPLARATKTSHGRTSKARSECVLSSAVRGPARGCPRGGPATTGGHSPGCRRCGASGQFPGQERRSLRCGDAGSFSTSAAMSGTSAAAPLPLPLPRDHSPPGLWPAPAAYP
jgi:hypothetical protein